MKYTKWAHCLTLPLLRYVRDHQPTEEMMVAWLGTPNAGQYHVLKKAGFLQCENGQVRLSPQYVFRDGKEFRVGNTSFLLDDNTIRIFRSEESGPET